MNLLKIVTLSTLKVVLVDHPNRLKQIDYLQIENFLSQPSQIQEYFCPKCMCTLRKNISHLIHQMFCRVSITRLKIMAGKVLMEGQTETPPDLE